MTEIDSKAFLNLSINSKINGLKTLWKALWFELRILSRPGQKFRFAIGLAGESGNLALSKL